MKTTKQNTVIATSDEVLKSTNIEPYYVVKLEECSEVLGVPVSKLLDQAIYFWLENEAIDLMKYEDPNNYSFINYRLRKPKGKPLA